MTVFAQHCITSVAASVAFLMGIEPPTQAGAADPALTQLKTTVLGGQNADRVLLYNPDAVAHYLYEKYTDLFLPVLRHTQVQLPLQSVMPSVTPVCFASMYSGAMPEKHGIQAYVKPVLTIDTLFDALLRAGKKPAIVSTEGDSISKIFLERDMDYFLYDSVEAVNEKAAELIQADEHDLIVVYNRDYDATMHRFSPESPESLQALQNNAAAFDRLASLTETCWAQHNTVLAFAPDHGCHAIDGGLGSHGLEMEEDMRVIHCYGARAAKL